ncbi:MAG: hypothetical protein PVS2B2_17140 [Candidatus Acidiferrum sp.]
MLGKELTVAREASRLPERHVSFARAKDHRGSGIFRFLFAGDSVAAYTAIK